MTAQKTTSPQADRSADQAYWDTYWQGMHDNAAHGVGGVQNDELQHYWSKVFANLPSKAAPTIVDIGSGNGGLTAQILQASPEATVIASDASTNALYGVKQRFSQVECVAADAAALPLSEGSVDLMVSQFGIEYAGAEAIVPALNCLAPGGYFAALMHLRDGVIHRECANDLAALEATQKVEVLPLAQKAFAAGYALNAKEITPAEFLEAERHFAPAVRSLEVILARWGKGAAGGLLDRLYSDIAQMYPRMSSYDPAEVLQLLERMEQELEAYRGRMASMCEVAFDAEALDTIIAQLDTTRFSVESKQVLTAGRESAPCAWVLELQRAS